MQYLDKTGLEYYHSKIKDNLKTYYGTCTTSASTQAKVVTCSGFKLETGAKITVKFTNAQTYNGTATLNVNSTGAKNICRVGTTTTTRYYWSAGEVVDFVYDGTNYVMEGKGVATTTYYGVTKLSSSTSSTSTSLAATPSAVKAAYDLANGKQDALVSGTNIKTINGESILGEGNITISSGGTVTATDVKVNGTSITSNGVANLITESAYNSSTNKIATKNDIPTNNNQLTNGAGYITGISKSDVTTALGYTPYNSTNPNGYTSNTGTITGVSANGTSVATSGVANIPAATTSKYGVTQLSSSTSSTSTSLAATPSAVKAAYDLANTANTQATTNATAIGENTTAITNLLNNLFYKAGDNFQLTNASQRYNVSGLVTSSRQSLTFTVFVPKSLKNISSISCTILKLNVRGINGYVGASAWVSEGTNFLDGTTVTATKVSDNAIGITVAISSSYFANSTNNTPVNVCVENMRLNFS